MRTEAQETPSQLGRRFRRVSLPSCSSRGGNCSPASARPVGRRDTLHPCAECTFGGQVGAPDLRFANCYHSNVMVAAWHRRPPACLTRFSAPTTPGAQSPRPTPVPPGIGSAQARGAAVRGGTPRSAQRRAEGRPAAMNIFSSLGWNVGEWWPGIVLAIVGSTVGAARPRVLLSPCPLFSSPTFSCPSGGGRDERGGGRRTLWR
jgi:hypothetical protein